MGMLWFYRTAEDLLKWYNTFTAHPEVIGLSKEALNNLTTPLQPIGVPSINASFAQGIAATGNKNLTDKVRSLTHPGTHFWGCHKLHDCILNADVRSSCQASDLLQLFWRLYNPRTNAGFAQGIATVGINNVTDKVLILLDRVNI